MSMSESSNLLEVRSRIQDLERELAEQRKLARQLTPRRVVWARRTIAAFLLLLPAQYLLSVGPMVWLRSRGYLPSGSDNVLERVYAPAEWACDVYSPLGDAMNAYVQACEL